MGKDIGSNEWVFPSATKGGHMKLAGHADLNTTMRYVHLNDDDVREAMEKAEQAQGRHKIGHSGKNPAPGRTPEKSAIN